MCIIAILNFSTKSNDIDLSRAIMVLLLDTEINIDILTWIVTILIFSTKTTAIVLSRFNMVFVFSTSISDIELN